MPQRLVRNHLKEFSIDMNKKVRYKSLDVTKGFLILLVIISHIPNLLYHNHQLLVWVHSFFMPAFFVCSGLFFKPMDSCSLIKKKSFTLLLPYLIFTVWGWMSWVGRTILKHDTDFRDLYEFLLGGNNYNGVLWFLIAMFWVNVVVNEIVKAKNAYVQLLLVLLISYAAYFFQNVSWLALYNIRSALLCVPFFWVSYICKDHILSFIQSQRKYIPVICLLTAILYYYFHNTNNIAVGVVRWSYVSFYAYVFLITILLLCISDVVQNLKIGRIMAYIGERSLGVMCVHLAFIYCQYFILNVTPYYGLNIVILLVVVLLESIVFTNILLKYLPWALGRKTR